MTSVPAEQPGSQTTTIPAEPLTADTFDDGDSAISTPLTDGLTSLRSSILKFQEENGHTYHSMSGGKYAFPNDDTENARLEIQHNLWLFTLRGDLGLSPKATGGAKRVLDAGTGTGIWAIEYADQFPESEVIGVDLSPIQPGLVPPNCLFESDDLEKDWLWAKPFDFIFARVMTGSFTDMEQFVKKSYANLEPGGYLEMQDITVPYACDDGTLTPENPIARASSFAMEASYAAGRPMDVAPKYKSYLERAGFTDIVERRFKWPFNEWPRDPHHKELGMWTRENFNIGLEGLCMALFTRYLAWSKEEVLVFAAQVRAAIRDRNVHAYIPIYVVYGRKPGVAPGAEGTA